MKKAIKLFILCIIPTLCICTFALEIGLRVSGRLPSNVTDGIFVQNGPSYKLKKNIHKVTKTPHFSCTYYTNSYGFRDRQAGPREIGSRPYYLVMGESLTFGNGIDFDQSFVGILGQHLDGHGLDIVNLAVGGHRFLEQQGLLQDFLNIAPFKPQKVIVCFSPLFIEGFDKPYSDIIIKNGYAFENGNWLIPYVRIVLGNTSAAYCFFRDSIRKIQAKIFDYDMTHALELFRFYSNDNRLATPAVAADFEHSLANLDRYITSLGAKPIYIYLPLSTDFMLDGLLEETGNNPKDYDALFYYKLLEKHCHSRGIPILSLYPVLKEHCEKGEVLNFIIDPHYNALANRVIAETIIPFILIENDPR